MIRVLRFVALVLAPLAITVAMVPTAAPPVGAAAGGTYHNPLRPQIAGDGTVDSCADPTVIRGRGAFADTWFMYCTTDPLNDRDTAGNGPVTFHPVPMMRSTDLVNWTYVGDALPQRPSWAAPTAFLWAPDVVYSSVHRRYYMTFVVTDTVDAVSGEPGCTGDSAIGVATSRTPTGPWRTSDRPVVGPRRAGEGCNFFWTFDPDVLGESIGVHSVLYYGSYFGGVFARNVTLTPHGMHTIGPATRITAGLRHKPAVDPVASRLRGTATRAARQDADGAQQVTIPNRYEGTNVIRHGGWYYLFASASNCCNGPLTGYSVFSGRSRSPFGPFVDREGVSLLAGRVGGTPVISMNGNRWVGTGHNTVFRDFDGQWWTVYHAVDRTAPYFATEPGFTKRPALIDPLDWVDGWPSVRSGRWASDTPMPAPAAQPGERTSYVPQRVEPDVLGERLDAFSDEFDGSALSDRWTWVRAPDPATYGVEEGRLRFHTQNADLFVDSNTASVLTEHAPDGSYVVETKVALNVPAEGCCQNFVQAGVVIYGSDNAFIKLTHTSIFETRQTEFAKEVESGERRYGNTVVGPPGDDTWLRIVRRESGDEDLFTAYTSNDGVHWVRGGTWTHDALGDNERIGLVSMGGPGDFTARFDHVRVWSLR